MCRRLAVLRAMLDEGVDLTAVEPRSGFCVLHAACAGGQAALLEVLLDWVEEVPTIAGPAALRDSMHRPLDDDGVCRCDCVPLLLMMNLITLTLLVWKTLLLGRTTTFALKLQFADLESSLQMSV
jgi:hypothetical protein